MGITAILLLTSIFVVPALVNVDRYRTQLISYLQEKTGKQVEIGRLALTFFPVTIHIDHIGVKNPPIFPAGYGIQAARIDPKGLSASEQHQCPLILAATFRYFLTVVSSVSAWTVTSTCASCLRLPRHRFHLSVCFRCVSLDRDDPLVQLQSVPSLIWSGNRGVMIFSTVP